MNGPSVCVETSLKSFSSSPVRVMMNGRSGVCVYVVAVDVGVGVDVVNVDDGGVCVDVWEKGGSMPGKSSWMRCECEVEGEGACEC